MELASAEIDDPRSLPPQLALQPGAVIVQPDAVIESSGTSGLVEAKQIRGALSQPEHAKAASAHTIPDDVTEVNQARHQLITLHLLG